MVGEQHPLAAKTEVELKELNSIPLALGSRRWAGRRMIDAFLFENGVSPNVLIEADDLLALLKILTASNVGSLLTRPAVAKYPNLRLVPIAGKQQLYISFGVLWNKQGRLSPAAQAFSRSHKTKK